MATYVLDTECYKDYFLLLIEDVDTGAVMGAEMFPGHPFPLTQLPPGQYITFNGINYDFPILSLALAGHNNEFLKLASDKIIVGGMKPWEFRDSFGGVDMSGVDHIDLIEVAPGQCSLKAYGGRLHAQKLQDLPIEPSASISASDRADLTQYCKNDLALTKALYLKLKPQIDLRISMSEQYGVDLRSKSDAQIAEAVIKKEVEVRVGHRIYRPDISPDYKFNYIPPCFIAFLSDGMKLAFDIVCRAELTLNEKGSVVMPRELEEMRIRIGQGVYRMGIGGLHSTESSVSYRATPGMRIVDRDVTSFYPAIVLTQGLYPKQMGPDFLAVYKSLVDRRVAAKASGDTVTNEVIKVVINGSFGKFGSKWSTLYAPELMIQVTITGQLAILMLIELVESIGVRVVSANTDGIVMLVPNECEESLSAMLSAWEIVSGYQTEETEYSAIYAANVNNYIAVKTDGSVKQKGIYAFVGSKKSELEKNPTNAICVDAVIALLSDGTPIDRTIYRCEDIKRFLTCRQVKGGAMYDGAYLGKAVRWVYGLDKSKCITYKTNGNKVARSDGAMPLMGLPELYSPIQIDYDWYINEAMSILRDIGAV